MKAVRNGTYSHGENALSSEDRILEREITPHVPGAYKKLHPQNYHVTRKRTSQTPPRPRYMYS